MKKEKRRENDNENGRFRGMRNELPCRTRGKSLPRDSALAIDPALGPISRDFDTCNASLAGIL